MTTLHINSRFPDKLGTFANDAPEVMYYLYYPVKVPGQSFVEQLPANLQWVIPMLNAVRGNAPDEWLSRYVYITCKNMYVEPGSYGNRPGWHGDGFGTDDLNFVWCSASPTEFCVQDFHVSEDDAKSLVEFEEQAKPENIKLADVTGLYRIDASHIHRVAVNKTGGSRCFVKLSLSSKKFNLAGNSINPRISGKWQLHSRNEIRNMESKNN